MSHSPVAPDDLTPGKTYWFNYRGHTGKRYRTEGVYLRCEGEFGLLWFWFRVEGKRGRYEVPYAYADLADVRIWEMS